jgi:2-oxoisovalerate dehydrogenase E1 component
VSTPSESALAKRAARGLNRAAIVDANFVAFVRGLAPV